MNPLKEAMVIVLASAIMASLITYIVIEAIDSQSQITYKG